MPFGLPVISTTYGSVAEVVDPRDRFLTRMRAWYDAAPRAG
jgi:hypothetical protein